MRADLVDDWRVLVGCSQPVVISEVRAGLCTMIGQLLALKPQRQDVETEVVSSRMEIVGPVELFSMHPGGEHSQGRLVGDILLRKKA